LSTRRSQIGDQRFGFDHGAQYFTARDPRFAQLVVDMAGEGAVAPWRGRIGRWQSGVASPEARGSAGDESAPATRWVGVPGMSAVLHSLSKRSEVEVHFGQRVEALERFEAARSASASGPRWRLQIAAATGDRSQRDFEQVVLAVPAVQAHQLLADSGLFSQRFDQVKTAPCHTLMLATRQPIDFEYDGLLVSDHPVASWIARNSSKPGRSKPSGGETWVLQSAADWSERHLEEEPASLDDVLMAAFEDCVASVEGAIEHRAVHRWRYARTVDALAEPSVWDAANSIAMCGDWCLGARVEAAFLSGLSLAQSMVGRGGIDNVVTSDVQ
jgi:predicted NAD/FAD-dependent oxidoreductase